MNSAATGLLAALIVLFSPVPAVKAEVLAGLSQTGSGEITYLGFIKVYDAAFFAEPEVTRETALAPTTSRCLQLVYDVDLAAEDFIEAANTILARQHAKEVLQQLTPEIELLHQKYRPVSEGDSYLLCYDGGEQITTLALNGEPLVQIESADFATLYFGIWLGAKDPIDDDLRDDLLSGLQ